MRIAKTLIRCFVFALPGISLAEPAASEPPPQELKQFVAKDQSILAFQSADLNGDGLRDFVFIVEALVPNDAGRADDEGARTLKIALRTANGGLKVVKQSTKVVFCRACGGVFGDPFGDLSASRKTFSVHHYGGSNWRWTNTYTFNYSNRDETWQLVRVDEASFHTSDPEKRETRTLRPPRNFGKIDIAEFNPDKFEGVGAK